MLRTGLRSNMFLVQDMEGALVAREAPQHPKSKDKGPNSQSPS